MLGLILLLILLGHEEMIFAFTRRLLVFDFLLVFLIVILDEVQVLILAILRGPRSDLDFGDKLLETFVLLQQSSVIIVSLSDLETNVIVGALQLDLVISNNCSIVSEHLQLHIFVLELAILLCQLSLAGLQVGVKISGISDFPHEVELVHGASLIEPTAPSLHLGVSRSVLHESHGQDLTLDVVVEELVTLHHQMVRNGLVLVQLVTALFDLFGCQQRDLLQHGSAQLLKL